MTLASLQVQELVIDLWTKKARQIERTQTNKPDVTEYLFRSQNELLSGLSELNSMQVQQALQSKCKDATQEIQQIHDNCSKKVTTY